MSCAGGHTDILLNLRPLFDRNLSGQLGGQYVINGTGIVSTQGFQLVGNCQQSVA
jgi:hypothetical protein